MPQFRPEPPYLSLETFLIPLPLQIPPEESLWLHLTPNPPPPHKIRLTFGGPPPPAILITPERAQKWQEYDRLKKTMATITRVSERMAEFHYSCTLPLPDPADPKGPYHSPLRPDNAATRLLTCLRKALNPAAGNQNKGQEPLLLDPEVPHLLPLGLYEHYRQRMAREQEIRLQAVLTLGPLLAAAANQPPKQPFPWEESRQRLRELIRIEESFQPGPTLEEFFAGQPPEQPRGTLNRLLLGRQIPGYRTAALYYAAGHAARQLTQQRREEADPNPGRSRPPGTIPSQPLVG